MSENTPNTTPAARTSKRRLRLALGGSALAATIAVGAVACSSDSDTGASSASDATPAAAKEKPAAAKKKTNSVADDVTITKSGFEDDEMYGPNAYVVHYKITNSTDSPKDYFVQLKFVDKDGDQLGTTGVTADALGAGKSKTDKTAPLDVEIENGKISDIKGVEVVGAPMSTRTAPTDS